MVMRLRTFLILLLLEYVRVEDSNEKIIVDITGLLSCEDFKNEKFLTDDLVVKIRDVGEDEQEFYFSGFLKTMAEVNSEHQISLTLLKDTESGKEKLLSWTCDFCEGLKDKDCPYRAALEALGITGCPIAAEDYPIRNDSLTVNMNELSGFLQPENCGQYEAILTFNTVSSPTTPISCHIIRLSMISVE